MKSFDKTYYHFRHKLQFLALHTLLQGQADIVEGSGEVDRLGLDGERATADGRGLDDIVDESLQHIAGVTDNADVLATLGIVT